MNNYANDFYKNLIEEKRETFVLTRKEDSNPHDFFGVRKEYYDSFIVIPTGPAGSVVFQKIFEGACPEFSDMTTLGNYAPVAYLSHFDSHDNRIYTDNKLLLFENKHGIFYSLSEARDKKKEELIKEYLPTFLENPEILLTNIDCYDLSQETVERDVWAYARKAILLDMSEEDFLLMTGKGLFTPCETFTRQDFACHLFRTRSALTSFRNNIQRRGADWFVTAEIYREVKKLMQHPEKIVTPVEREIAAIIPDTNVYLLQISTNTQEFYLNASAFLRKLQMDKTGDFAESIVEIRIHDEGQFDRCLYSKDVSKNQSPTI